MNAERILVYLVMLSVLVVLHEYGHFLIARRNGVRVTDFAVGMGPTLLKWTSPRSGTHYRLNLLPIGGYCQMKGEDGKTSEADQQREFRRDSIHDQDNFQAKSPLQRLGIVVAGPIANFIVALVLLFGGALVFGVPGSVPTTTVVQLIPGMPADRAGLRPGDRILSVDGQVMRDGNVLVDTIHARAGKRLHIVYVRAGRTTDIDVTPVLSRGPNGRMEGHLGFAPLTASEHVGVAEAWSSSWRQFSGTFAAYGHFLGSLVTQPSSVVGQVAGPIGMARMTSEAQDLGPAVFISLAAAISVTLGIFNLLPLPALDGGRAAFILVEMLRGRPVDPEREALVHVGGFAVLILLMLVVSYRDVAAWVAGKAVM